MGLEGRLHLGRRGVAAKPNTYEASFCQETDFPSERVVAVFPAFRTWRRLPSGACAACMSVCRAHPGVAAPHPYCGAVATWGALAENQEGALLRPSNNAVPSDRPSMWPLLSSPLRILSPLPSLDTVSHGPDRSGGFRWRWDPSVSNDLLAVRARTPLTRVSLRLATRAGRPG